MKKLMKKINKRIAVVIVLVIILIAGIICVVTLNQDSKEDKGKADNTVEATDQTTAEEASKQTESTTEEKLPEKEEISWDPDWEYADYSKIHTGTAVLYYSQVSDRKDTVICINAGHGTEGGSSEYTQCHPDGSAKVTGGSTAKGSTTATAINEGTSLLDGTSEADMNLKVALAAKEKLLEKGFDVLMIRESEDVQLDNIARTVIANNNADCHISIHYDSTESDKGAFYISVPDVSSYRSMEPVASHWEEHDALGQSLISGLENAGVSIYGQGSMAIDLTQTSYSTIPSVDLEVGDRASSSSDDAADTIAEGIADGAEAFFESK